MPFRSRAQAKWAFATKKPWARKWGQTTREEGGIARLPQYVARKSRKWGKKRGIEQKDAPSATPAIGNASGPGGLFNAAGLEKAGASAVVNRRPHYVNRVRRARPQITIKSEGHTSAMVALYLPLDASKVLGQAAVDLFGDRAENVEDLHITLAYLGKVDDIEDKLPVLVPAIQRYTQMWLETMGIPIPVQVGGYNAFDTVQEDGSIPIYREVVSPLLMSWVEGLEAVLTYGGVPAARDYGPYRPHITVAYSYPELKQLLADTPATPMIVQFTAATLALGDIHINLPLALPTFKAVASDDGKPVTTHVKPTSTGAPAAAAPTGGGGGGGGGSLPAGVTRIRGNLCNVHGKFGPCDSATATGFGGKPKKPKAGGKGKAGTKPKLSEADRKAKHAQDKVDAASAAAQQKVQNRTESLAKLSNRPTDAAMGVLDQLRQGGTGDPALLKSMEHTGLVQKHSDGSYTLSSQGHGLLNALDKGDAGAAAEAIAGGGDKVAGEADRAAQRDQAIKTRAAQLAQRDADRKARQAQTAARRAKMAKQRQSRAKNPSKPGKSTKPTKTARKPIGTPVNTPTPTPTPAPAPAPATSVIPTPIASAPKPSPVAAPTQSTAPTPVQTPTTPRTRRGTGRGSTTGPVTT